MKEETACLSRCKKKYVQTTSESLWDIRDRALLGNPKDCLIIGMGYYRHRKYERAIKYLKVAEESHELTGKEQRLIDEAIGDILAICLNKPIEALSYYGLLGESVLNAKYQQIRPTLRFFRRRRFDAAYSQTLATLNEK